MTPSDRRRLDWLEARPLWTAGRLPSPDRRWQRAAERRCWDALHPWLWPPLPGGRRARRREHARRLGVVLAERSALAAVLVRRLRSLVPVMSPPPVHGPTCPPGCAECRAIASWRAAHEVLSGTPAAERELFWL